MGTTASKTRVGTTAILSNSSLSSSLDFPSSSESSIVSSSQSSVPTSGSATRALVSSNSSLATTLASIAQSASQRATSISTQSSTFIMSTSVSATPSAGNGDDSGPSPPSGSSANATVSSTTSRISSSVTTSSSQSLSSIKPSASGTGSSEAHISSTQVANGILISTSASSTTSDDPKEGSTSSGSTGQQVTSSHGPEAPISGGSTSVKTVIQTFPSSTLTNTITHAPESTLTSAVGVTVTSNGHAQISFPALVTFVTTSSFADGDLTTWTTVLANPTNAAGATANDSSFAHNKGALGGTIAAIVIVVLAMLAGLTICCRRRGKRRMKRRQWIHNIQARLPAPEDPFENPRDAPVMRSLSQTSRNEHHYHFQSNSPTSAQTFLDQQSAPRFDAHPATIVPANSLGLTGMDAMRMSTFSDSPYTSNSINNRIGLAVTTDGIQAHQSRPSLAQSSPSLYPPSIPLPNDDASVYEEIDLMKQDAPTGSHVGGLPSPISPIDSPFDDAYGLKPQSSSTVGPAPSLPVVAATAAPLRPARSVLRETRSKVTEYHLATPPSSLSGHGHGNFDEVERERLSPSPSLLSDDSVHESVPTFSFPSSTNLKQSRPNSGSKNIEDVVARRTLLDVRPRRFMNDV